jgi:hypothetical protein
VPTTSACIGANVPPTTALRWLRILEARGLVEREDDGRDGRRTFVCLTARGQAAMIDLMLNWQAGKDQWRRPRRQEMLPSHHAGSRPCPLTSSWTERLTEKSGALAKAGCFRGGIARKQPAGEPGYSSSCQRIEPR